ncbi:MAG: FAD-binding oxidoreductase [Myxococcota bacterium]
MAIAVLVAGPGAQAGPVVDDVTRINPIAVDRIEVPKTVDEVRRLVMRHPGPISIGGGHFSMGGQTASEGTLHLDLRRLDRIVDFSPGQKWIRVEAGITWRAIQEVVDRHDLSVSIMQSYANFTVGGSLGVNVHGRYVGEGPLIGSVREIAVVLADGSLVEASPERNAELFFGCIGGYGGLGVIVEATLSLSDDVRVERRVDWMAVSDYHDWFFSEIAPSQTAVFHNGDIYPPDYERVAAITWSQTGRPVTVEDRLQPIEESYPLSQLFYAFLTEAPFARTIRERVVDPLRLRSDAVVWRNYEASYDVGELEPRSRERSTYVLQEYFVPVHRFGEFVPKMAEIFQRYDVDVVNVSIRHATADPGSLLAWAQEEVFAFVVYYKQGTRPHARTTVGIWTRELVEAVLSVGGTWYLPYQIHATPDQFRRGYPRADAFFALKARVDPSHRFRNKLWDAYAPAFAAKGAEEGTEAPRTEAAPTEAPLSSAEIRARLAAVPGHVRSGDQTFLTLPEWFIVYSADEFADFVETRSPSDFPYFGSIAQFWRMHRAVASRTGEAGEINWGYHVMIGVIGASYSVELGLKGAYEKTIGELTSRLAAARPGAIPDTSEDRFARDFARAYADFVHATPWYEFEFTERIPQLWSLEPVPGESALRRWERRGALTLELLAKAGWGSAIGWATRTGYDPAALQIEAWVEYDGGDAALAAIDPSIEIAETIAPGVHRVVLPRYEPFAEVVRAIVRGGGRIVEVAGNDRILITLLAPSEWHDEGHRGELVGEWPLPTDPSRKRVALFVDIGSLHETLPDLERQGAGSGEAVVVEHLYDF